MELFRTDEILVRTNDLATGGEVCFVVFQPWNNPPSLSNPGFGEKFFKDLSIPAVFIIPSINGWYQSPDAIRAISEAAVFASKFNRRVTYGSSMGGYAAINFAKAVNASLYLALMPQFSIDRRKVPFEYRWSEEAAQIDFRHDDISSFDRSQCDGFVLYDPFNWRERRHVEMIERATGCRRIPLPLIGHNGPAGQVLKTLIARAVTGEHQGMESTIRQVHRQTRSTNPPYFVELARHRRIKNDMQRRRILQKGLAATNGHASIVAELQKMEI